MKKELLRLSLPHIFSNVTIPLLSSVDLGLMGHEGDSAFVGAVSLGAMVFAFLYWSFAFLRIGTSGLTSQAYGRKDNAECGHILFRALGIALLTGILIILFRPLILNLAFSWELAEEKVESLSRTYCNIRFLGAPAALSLFALNGWFVGMQNARYPMYILLFVNSCNIVLDVLFVKHFGWAVSGVALGTALSNYGGLFLGLWLLQKKYKSYLLTPPIKTLLFHSGLKKLLSLNFHIFLRTLMIICVFAYMQFKPAQLSKDLLACNAILMQLVLFFTFFVDGLAYGAESLSGKFIGAKDKSSFLLMLKWACVFSLAIALVFFLSFGFFGHYIVKLMTDLPQVQSLAGQYIWLASAMGLCAWGGFLWDGIYIGATASKAMLFSVGLSFFGIFIPVAFLLGRVDPMLGIWLAFNGFFLGRSIFQTIWAKRVLTPLFS